MRCTAHARLEEIVDGRKLRFAVQVTSADGRTIGVGRHERRVIDADPTHAG
jgi:predicted thioesterase